MRSSKVNVGIFTYKTLVHAIAGSTGSVVAMTTFYPLDTVRSRLQLEDRKSKNTLLLLAELVKEEGFETLYRGLFPVLKSLWASNFVYFYTFHGLKLVHGDETQNATRDLLLGAIAGIVNVLTTTPLWVVNTRLKMMGVKSQKNFNYDGLLDGLAKIKREEGIKALWRGTLPSLILVANPALQFMLYEAVKRQLPKLLPNKKIGPLDFFFVGAFAKAVSTIVTYPIQLIQAKLRHGHNYPGLAQNPGMFDLITYIIKKNGILGLYKGMEAKIFQTVLTAALMFATYEKISLFVFRVLKTKSCIAPCM